MSAVCHILVVTMPRKIMQAATRQSCEVFLTSLVFIASLVVWTRWPDFCSNRVWCKGLQTENLTKKNIDLSFSLCNCVRQQIAIGGKRIPSDANAFEWCSSESSNRGMGQKVIAYTLYGNLQNSSIARRYYSTLKFFRGTNPEKLVNVLSVIITNIKVLRNISITAEKLYPGWIVRIYHNMRDRDGPEREGHNQLCEIYCKFPNVDLCSIPTMVDNIGNKTKPIDPDLLEGLNPRMFRYLAMVDENVDVFISRDIDSIIWPREVDAVAEWLKSNFTFHAMRDHDYHATIILAGMWGAKIYQRRDLISGLTRALILAGQDQFIGQDQSSLVNIVWPAAKYDVMVHDSYNCKNENLTRESPVEVFPFPTQRNGNYYVGGLGGELYPWECPEACRPAHHKDWEYC